MDLTRLLIVLMMLYIKLPKIKSPLGNGQKAYGR